MANGEVNYPHSSGTEEGTSFRFIGGGLCVVPSKEFIWEGNRIAHANSFYSYTSIIIHIINIIIAGDLLHYHSHDSNEDVNGESTPLTSEITPLTNNRTTPLTSEITPLTNNRTRHHPESSFTSPIRPTTATTSANSMEEDPPEEDGETTPLTRHHHPQYQPNNNNNNNALPHFSKDKRQNSRREPRPASEPSSCKARSNSIFAITASILALVLCARALWTDACGWKISGYNNSTDDNNNATNTIDSNTTLPSENYPQYTSSSYSHLFDNMGRYIFEDYDAQTVFSDFLPGLAGVYGKPLYAFYINRGQAIAAFGVKSKQYPILEFESANKAYQSTALLGFRTFLQGSRPSNSRLPLQAPKRFVVEPFSPLVTRFTTTSGGSGEKKNSSRRSSSSSSHSTGSSKHPRRALLPKRIMYAGANELQLQELDLHHSIETNVTYFILPEEDFGAFARRTQITNTHPKQPLTLSVLDGLAQMEPAGGGGKMDKLLKTIGRTLEGWMGVYFPYQDKDGNSNSNASIITMPFYRLSTLPQDSDKVQVQHAGHYCLSFVEDDAGPHLLPIVYDTSKVFGQDSTLLQPRELYQKSIGDIIRGPQYGWAKTSSAFAAGTCAYVCVYDSSKQAYSVDRIGTRAIIYQYSVGRISPQPQSCIHPYSRRGDIGSRGNLDHFHLFWKGR
jgi:hypothetical protein